MTALAPYTADLKVRDRLLDALTVASGAMDAISFVAFGRVFTAFMTGNIVFLGLRLTGATDAPGHQALVASIVGFAFGVYLVTKYLASSPLVRGWSRDVTRALAMSLLFHVVALAIWLKCAGEPQRPTIAILLLLWGLAMGMQTAAVRALHVDAVFTTAATATVVFLAGDVASWRVSSVERRRLASIVLSLLIGASAGGLLLVRARIYAPVLPFLITAAVVAIAARLWRKPAAAADLAPASPRRAAGTR